MYVDYFAVFNINNQQQEIQIFRFTGDLNDIVADQVVKELKTYIIDNYENSTLQHNLLSLVNKKEFIIRSSEGATYCMPGIIEVEKQTVPPIPVLSLVNNLPQDKTYTHNLENLSLKDALERRKLLLADLIKIKQQCELLESELISLDKVIRPKIESHRSQVLEKQQEVDKQYKELQAVREKLKQEIELINSLEVEVVA